MLEGVVVESPPNMTDNSSMDENVCRIVKDVYGVVLLRNVELLL